MPTTLKLSDQYWYGNEAFADGSIIDPVKERLYLGNWIPQLDCGLDTTVRQVPNITGSGDYSASGISWDETFVKTMSAGLAGNQYSGSPTDSTGGGMQDTGPRSSCICYPTLYEASPNTNAIGWSKMTPIDNKNGTTATNGRVGLFSMQYGSNGSGTRVSGQTMWVAIPAFMTRRFQLGPAAAITSVNGAHTCYIEPEIQIDSYNYSTRVATMTVRLLIGTGKTGITFTGATTAQCAKIQLYYNGATLGAQRIFCDPNSTGFASSTGWKVAPTGVSSAEATNALTVTANANDIYNCTFGIVVTAGTGTPGNLGPRAYSNTTQWTLNRNLADWATGYKRC